LKGKRPRALPFGGWAAPTLAYHWRDCWAILLGLPREIFPAPALLVCGAVGFF